MLFNFIRDT